MFTKTFHIVFTAGVSLVVFAALTTSFALQPQFSELTLSGEMQEPTQLPLRAEAAEALPSESLMPPVIVLERAEPAETATQAPSTTMVASTTTTTAAAASEQDLPLPNLPVQPVTTHNHTSDVNTQEPVVVPQSPSPEFFDNDAPRTIVRGGVELTRVSPSWSIPPDAALYATQEVRSCYHYGSDAYYLGLAGYQVTDSAGQGYRAACYSEGSHPGLANQIAVHEIAHLWHTYFDDTDSVPTVVSHTSMERIAECVRRELFPNASNEIGYDLGPCDSPDEVFLFGRIIQAMAGETS